MHQLSARSTPGRRGMLATAIGLVLALVLALAALAPTGSNASSHREAPLIAGDPQADNTDTYAFRSPDRPNTVTLLGNWIPLEEPAGGPTFYPFAENAHYDINVDNDADARPDIIYRWEFTTRFRTPGSFAYNTGVVTSLNDRDLNLYQTYDLYEVRPGSGSKRLVNDAIAAPSRVGDASMPDYEQLFNAGIESFQGEPGRNFVGQADDPFFIDLRVFDLLYGLDFSEVGDDTVAGFNTNSLAVQVPRSDLAKGRKTGRNPIIGVWATTSRKRTRVLQTNGQQSSSGRFVQVSRLGNPLVNEVVIPLRDKDRFNASKPVNDAQFLRYVTNPEVPRLVEAIYGIPAPATPRRDLVQVFLTGVPGLNKPAGVVPSEQIRLNMTTPVCEQGSCAEYSRLGVIGGDFAGYPNGRRLADDIVDITLQVAEGELVGNPNNLSDLVNRNDFGFMDSFPYVALPTSGSEADPHP